MHKPSAGRVNIRTSVSKQAKDMKLQRTASTQKYANTGPERKTDLSRLGRLGLTPEPEVAGLIQGLELGARVRSQLRPFLEADPAPPHIENAARMEGAQEEADLREAERWLMEAQARVLKSKSFGMTPIIPRRQKKLLPVWRIARDVVEQRAVHTGLLLDGSGKFELAEYPDQGPCEHMMPLLEHFMPGRREPEVETQHRSWIMVEKKSCFTIQPQSVCFRELTVGKTYTRRLLVRNAGQHSASFSLHGPSSRGVFSLSTRGYKGQVLAPGLSVQLELSFSCGDKRARSDSLHLLAGEQHIVVPIHALQDPPLLVSVSCPLKLFGKEAEGDGEESLLEFDKCFVGDMKLLKLRLENQGPAARFFIMKEVDWAEQAVEGVSGPDYAVVSEPFVLRPAYFSLETGEEVELELGFRPTCAGSHVARLYVICDNATLRPLDLLGEALVYCGNLVHLQNFEKRYNIFIEDEVTAKYYFYIGEFYANTKAKRTFEVKNTSLVEMEYSWVPADEARGKFLVCPDRGPLRPKKGEFFTASCDTTRLPPGRHRAIFTLMLNGIPIKAFPEKYKEEIKTDDCNKKGSIEVAVIEIWVDIIMPAIYLKEYYIHLTTTPDQLECCSLYVMNESRLPVTVLWELAADHGCRLSVSPAVCGVQPLATTIFRLRFSGSAPGTYVCRLRAVVRELDSLQLEAVCEVEVRTGLEGGSLVEDLGLRRVGQPYHGSVVLPSHLAKEKNVKLSEFMLREYGDGENNLVRTNEVAEYVPALRAVTFMISIEEEELGLVLLDMDYKRGHFFILILSDFQELDVSLEQAKFVFKKHLFIGKEKTVRLRLVNHKLLEARFTLGEWFGPDCRAVDLSYCPPQGTVRPGRPSQVVVTVRPLIAGYISDVFIPCFVEGQKEPLIAQLVGQIKDREVKISWATEGQMMIVLWPEEEWNQENPKPNSLQESKKSTEIITSEGAEEGSLEVEGEGEEEGSRRGESSSLGTVPYEKWPLVGGRYYGAEFLDNALEKDFNTPWTCESLDKQMKTFTEQERTSTISFFSKKALCFDMNLFEESTMEVEIFNVAPTPCTYKAKVKFFKTVKNPVRLNPIAVAEMQVFGRKRLDVECPELVKRRWQTQIQPQFGLGVRVTGREGAVAGRASACLKVTAYALVWGLYLDTLQIQIDGLPTFHLPLLFRVTGSPAFFTYNLDTSVPTLRFSSVPPNALRRQTVYLRNRCPLPLKVVWTVLTESPSADQPFSVQLELQPEDPHDFCRFHLTHYLGQPNSPYYSVEPRVSWVEAYGKAPVHILLDTALFKVDPLQLVRYLRATVLGTLYVQQEAREKRLIEEHLACYRPDGFNIKQVQLKLETRIEVPTIRLVNPSKTNALYEVKTRDIFCNPTKPYSEKRKFTLHNCALRKVFLKLLSSCPFSVTRVVTRKGEMPVSEEIVVDKQDVFEIEITLKLTVASIQENCDESYSYLDYPDMIRREFVCRERNYSENVFPLFLQIVKPQLNISINPVNFGRVLLEDVKTQIVIVTSKYGEEPYIITFKNVENVFYISPESGVIRPSFATHLTVKFQPKTCRKYCAKVRLVTTTPGYEASFMLFGEGVDYIGEDGSEEEYEGYDFYPSCYDSES